MNKKVVSISIGLLMIMGIVSAVSAQTSDTSVGSVQIMPVSVTVGDVDAVQTSTCVDLKSESLRYRSSDATTNGEVSMLQDFLVASSLLKSTVTGYFGLGTFAAVKQYQRSVGISGTGYVGPLTKAKIYEQSCSGSYSSATASGKGVLAAPGIQTSPANGQVPPPLANRPPNTLPGFASTTIRMCTMEARLCPDGTMMPRDPMTCAWLDTQCGKLPKPSPTTVGVPPRSVTPVGSGTQQVPAPLAPPIVLDGPLPPRSTGTPTGQVCTMEARMCGDGRPMLRNMTTCEWITTSCGNATGTVRVIVPSGSVPLPPVKPVPATIPAQPAVACTMQIKFCPDGVTVMPRDAQCGWHPEKCTGPSAPVGGSVPVAPLPLY